MAHATNGDRASILCVGNGWFPVLPGGLNRYVYELVYALAAAQTEVELCDFSVPAQADVPHLTFTSLGDADGSTWQRFLHSRRAFARCSFADIEGINLHFALSSLPLLALVPEQIPLTFTFHGPWSLEDQQEGARSLGLLLKRWVEQRVYRRCDRFIVLSQAFGQVLHETFAVPWDKINVIPGGVDTGRFCLSHTRQQARAVLGWPQDRQILFTPRRLVQRMGIDQLLLALVELHKRAPDVWLGIAGKGPLRETLEAKAMALGLAEYVTFLGFVPDAQLPIAYQAADLTVVPSESLEGFGLILLESLACGTPVLSTPVGGMPEVLQPFRPELITDAVGADAIAHRLQDILTGTIARPERQACRDYAANHFNWSDIAQQVKQVILGPA